MGAGPPRSGLSVSPARSGFYAGEGGGRGDEVRRRSVSGTPNRGENGRGRASAWDQPPAQHPVGTPLTPLAKSLSPALDRDSERSNAIRNLPDMREIRRIEPSPPPMMARRRLPSPPPRGMFGPDMRERGMGERPMGGGGIGGGGMGGGGMGGPGMGGGMGGDGGLSRESLRREREEVLMRERDRFGPGPGPGPESPRSRAMMERGPPPMSAWDMGPRARSPRAMDRSWERERERERGPPGGGASLGRDRSLSPRSKEVQREIQAARERRAGTKGAS